MKKLNPRIIAILLLVFLLIVFSIQNAEIIPIKVFFWTISIPRVLLILFSLIVGILIGLWFPSKRKQTKDL